MHKNSRVWLKIATRNCYNKTKGVIFVGSGFSFFLSDPDPICSRESDPVPDTGNHDPDSQP